jgi:uncharacterized protein YdaU (DUF1376 family)
MNGLPYYKRYPRDFIEGTIGMPFDLKGAYSMVLDLIYMQGGELPDDARYISGLLGCSSKQWTYFRKALIDRGKLEVRGDVLVNNRAHYECELTENLRRTQRDNRSKRGAAASNNNDITVTTVQPKPNHTESDTDTDKKKNREGRKRPPETELPPEWIPNERNVADAEARGFSQQEISDETDRFRDHHLARGNRMRNWDAAWRTWLGNARKFANGRVAGGAASGGRGPGGSLASIAAWRRASGAV